jgi:hypothetical protein
MDARLEIPPDTRLEKYYKRYRVCFLSTLFNSIAKRLIFNKISGRRLHNIGANQRPVGSQRITQHSK